MKKKKPILRIFREAILMLLALIIASGIGYQCSKTPEQHENDIKYLRTVLFSQGIYLKYKLPERGKEGMLLWDIGVVLVIFYFVCRNLYKTTRFVAHRMKSRKG